MQSFLQTKETNFLTEPKQQNALQKKDNALKEKDVALKAQADEILRLQALLAEKK